MLMQAKRIANRLDEPPTAPRFPIDTAVENSEACASLNFEGLVSRFYKVLYQFAFALTRSEAEACDLTQQTFYVWAEKGDQLRDHSKVKSWLFTSLHRAFLQSRRRQARFPHYELSGVELPSVPALQVNQLDAATVLDALRQVDEVYQAPVALFYLDDCAYKDIAEMLGVPLGTVKSRIARGIAQLQQILGVEPGRRPRRQTLTLGNPSRATGSSGLDIAADSRT
jgi:RNA polymerase sigma-70 factor, ECF subfamily